MNEAMLFQAAAVKDLTGLVPANPMNPPICAYPIFKSLANDATKQSLVVVRSLDATLQAVRTGATGLTPSKEDDIPAVFRAADKLMAPDAAVPTFILGRNGGNHFMSLIVLRSASIERASMVPALLGIDPVEFANVPVMMRKVHEFAVAKGHHAGFPTFKIGNNAATGQLEMEIVFLKNAEVINDQVKGPATWRFADMEIEPGHIGNRTVFGNYSYLVGGWTVVGRTPSPTVVLADVNKRVKQYSGAAGQFLSAPLPSVETTVNEGAARQGNMFQISATEFAGRLHALHYDDFLIHASRPAANADATWDSEILDGDGAAGHIDRAAGWENALVARPTPAGGEELHAFYFAESSGDTTTGILRHGQLDPASGSWMLEDLDGVTMDGAGAIQSDFADGLCALAEPDGRLHVFYHDKTKENLRHAVQVSPGGAWAFSIFDGSGGPVPPPGTRGTGPISGKVGGRPSAVLFDGGVYVFYDDSVNGNIRMAMRREGIWSFHVLDGSKWTVGTTSAEVHGSSAVVWDDHLSVLYADWTHKNLRHACLTQGSPTWRFETLDGEGGSAGQIDDEVGSLASAFAAGRANGGPSLPVAVAYMNAHSQKLRWAVLDTPILQ